MTASSGKVERVAAMITEQIRACIEHGIDAKQNAPCDNHEAYWEGWVAALEMVTTTSQRAVFKFMEEEDVDKIVRCLDDEKA